MGEEATIGKTQNPSKNTRAITIRRTEITQRKTTARRPTYSANQTETSTEDDIKQENATVERRRKLHTRQPWAEIKGDEAMGRLGLNHPQHGRKEILTASLTRNPLATRNEKNPTKTPARKSDIFQNDRWGNTIAKQSTIRRNQTTNAKTIISEPTTKPKIGEDSDQMKIPAPKKNRVADYKHRRPDIQGQMMGEMMTPTAKANSNPIEEPPEIRKR